MLTQQEMDEDDDLLNTYLMMFGTETLKCANMQEGESEFLLSVADRSPFDVSPWGRIQAALARRGGR